MQNPDRNGSDEEVDHSVDAVGDIENVGHRQAVSALTQATTCINKTVVILNVSTSVR